MKKETLQLGCGLIAIGRKWGEPVAKPVPTEHEVREFLEYAFMLGIRFFDTAPAYGLSEVRLGVFLASLTAEERSSVTVATKFGEHWVSDTENTVVDHSPEALQRSIENSAQLLGQIDILQIHKATTDVLTSDSVRVSCSAAQEQYAVSSIGASISTEEAGLLACSLPWIRSVQLPFNQETTYLLPVIQAAQEQGKQLIINRPLAMGKIVATHEHDSSSVLAAAFRFISEHVASGIVLTGTKSKQHLKENKEAFGIHA